MKTLIFAALLLPAVAFGGAFDGTWKMNTASYKSTGKPDVYLLTAGTYTCSTCNPPLTVKADGAEHPVTDRAYADTYKVTTTGPRTMELESKLRGKLVSHSVVSVSEDGKTLTGKFTDYTGEKPVNGEYRETRIAAGPAGAHPMSGSWQVMGFNGDDALGTLRMRNTTEGFALEWNGQKYDAKFDGKQYPFANDPGKTMVVVKQIDAATIEESDYRQGKLVDVLRYTVAKDGKTISVTDKALAVDQTTTYTLDRQP